MILKSFGKKFNVENFDEQTLKNKKKHGELFPNSIRAIICGRSNCGKTNLLISFITHPNGLRFRNIYIYSKSLNQPKYLFLEKVMKGIPSLGYFTFSANEEVISPNHVKSNSIIIFDDVISDSRQNNIKQFFSFGRHFSCDSFLLAQTYSAINKQLIRDNANFIILFKMDETNLRHVYNDFVNTDFSYYQLFLNLCT
uniref:Uncharacterized protein n=1 Tax=Cacopsylla melanoneura TaxID=428564 RepID=A0A8D8TTN8_9HEMI